MNISIYGNLDLKINKLYFLLGLFSGIYAVRFYNISLIFFPLLAILILNILYIHKYKFNIIIFYYFFIIISLIVSLEYGYKVFSSNLKNFEFIKILIFMFMSVFIIIKEENILYFFKGVKITILFNLIWGIIEYLSYHLYKFWWNEYIFESILKIDSGGHGWRYIRGINKIGLCGFSWDPLHLGILSALGFFLFDNKYLKIFSLIILILGGSRSGQVGLLASLIVFELLKNLRANNMNKLIKKIFKNTFLVLLCLLTVSLFFKYKVKNHKGDSRRKAYYISAVKSTVINNKFDLFLFGGSPFWSGAVLVLNEDLKKESYLEETMIKQIYWKIESDWVHILTGRGWIGFLSYIFIFFLSIFKVKDKKIQKIILLYFFAGIGYYFENSLFVNILLIYINQNYKLKIKRSLVYERNNTCRRKWDKTLSCYKSNFKADNTDL